MSDKSRKPDTKPQTNPSDDDKSEAEIDAGSVIMMLIIFLLTSLGFLWMHLLDSDVSEADVAPTKATENEITLVYAVEMNGCNAPNNDCYIYVANASERSTFLRLVLSNEDDHPMPVRRGTIHDIAVQMECAEDNRCKISTTRDYEARILTVKLATSSLSQDIQLVVPLLGDED